MSSLVINNTVQVRLIWARRGADFAVNVLHGIKKNVLTSPSQEGAAALAADLKTRLLASPIKPYLEQWGGLSAVGLRDLNSANNPEFLASVTGAQGGSTSDVLPLQVALCATLRTAKAGRSYRGRYYQSLWAVNASSDGIVLGAAQSALTAWVKDIQSAMDTAGLTLSVASRKLGTSEAVTSIVTRDTRWDTQRRRVVPGI